MSMTKKDLAVYIGRFQPPCNHHIETIRHGLNLADNILIFVGSANSPRSIKNPFSAVERIAMIQACLTPDEEKRVVFCPKEDSLYDDNQWVSGLEWNVNRVLEQLKGPGDYTTVIVGCKSDNTSWYLDKFPSWDKNFLAVRTSDDDKEVHATDVRNALFSGSKWVFDEVIPRNVFSAVGTMLRNFMKTPDFARLCEEQQMVNKYKESWKVAPYPPTFVCTDAVVVQSAHVLLVRRGANPGRGLWALPGGFLEQEERIADCAIRELKEETRIDVPPAVLYNSIKKSEVFDHPHRSLRGRTITHAFLIELREPHGMLPWIKGGDDCDEKLGGGAKWIPYSEILRMRDQMFEDHWDIINHMVGGLAAGNATPVIFGSNNLNR